MDSEPAEIVEIVDGPRRWRFDVEFLMSNWRCRWEDGCLGMLERPTPELRQGCCSHGAYLGDAAAIGTSSDGEQSDDARAGVDAPSADVLDLAAYATLLTPEQWQFHDVARRSDKIGPSHHELSGDDGPLAIFDDVGMSTRVVDGACIFLNRPGFSGGEGCALHLAAVAAGDSPIDWKPSVCWQLPLLVDWRDPDDGVQHVAPTTTVIDVRRWQRSDYGDHGERMAWCCTEPTGRRLLDAYDGDVAVVDSMRDELTAIAGEEVYIELHDRLARAPTAVPED